MSKDNFKELDSLIDFLTTKLEEKKVSTISAKIGELEVSVSNQINYAPVAAAQPQDLCSIQTPENCKPSSNSETVLSPMVGVVYLSPEPSAPTFVKKGQEVKEGDTLCLIEAMKTFNPVKATKSGKIIQILVNEGQSVEFETPLFLID